MPEGQQPVSTVVRIENKSNLKVYFALNCAAIGTNDWELEETLVCTGFTQTNGATLGQAFFVTLPSSQDRDSTAYQESEAIMRYDAPQFYNADLSSVYNNPFYVKVTDSLSGVEIPIFYGYIDSATVDVTGARSGLTAVSFAGLLSQVDLLGGFFDYNDSSGVEWFFKVAPIFNPKGLGNKSINTVSSGGRTANSIDESRIINGGEDKFTVLDVIEHVLQIALNDDAVLTDGAGSVKPYSFIRKLYEPGIVEISEEVQAVLDASYVVTDYSYVGKSFWDVLVELVESVENLIITEKLPFSIGGGNDVNTKPVISIVKSTEV